MGTMILISVVAIIVAIVGSFVIWRLDVARADEIEQPSAPRSSGPAIEGPAAVRPVALPTTPPAPKPAA